MSFFIYRKQEFLFSRKQRTPNQTAQLRCALGVRVAACCPFYCTHRSRRQDSARGVAMLDETLRVSVTGCDFDVWTRARAIPPGMHEITSMSYPKTVQVSLPFHPGVSFTDETYIGRFCVRDTNGFRTVSDAEIVAAALTITAEAHQPGTAPTSPPATRDYLRLRLSSLQHEVFGLLYLDNRHCVLAFEVLFRGTIDGANVHPREVVRSVIEKNAAAVIFFHNHPSGVPEPSQADELITRRLREALSLIDVRVLDHIIVGAERCESFAERGLL